MLRKLLIGGLLALVFAAPAAAQRTTLMPGVTYERSVQFTPHGPVAMHVVVGPRPTGLYGLRPVLSNESILGVERVTAMQKRLSATATMVGINGDFYAPDTGRPTGMVMRDGIVDSPPSADRSRSVSRRRGQSMFGGSSSSGHGAVSASGGRSPTSTRRRSNAISLFTPSYGLTTPAQAGVTEVVIQPFPAATANTDLVGPVVNSGRRRLDHPPRRRRARRPRNGG